LRRPIRNLLGAAAVVAAATCQSMESKAGIEAVVQNPEFVHAAGRRLVLDGAPFRFRAVNFSNDYDKFYKATNKSYYDATDALVRPVHHTEKDFARVKDLGFNSIRFAFSGDWHAKSPEVFWAWLDRNVRWARQHGVYLILDLHVPVGSFWLNPTSDRVSFAIWDDPEVRAKNIALWREVAARYRDEPYVAAYDVLNEPVTTDQTGQQWRDLARDLVSTIRAVDPNHLIVIGKLYGVAGEFGTKGLDEQFLVDDANVVYDFHFYEPIKYTHQYADWVKGAVRDGGKYPDPDVIIATGEHTILSESRIKSKSLASRTTDWARYDSGPRTISDKTAVAALPMMTVRGAMKGKVFFDALEVEEYGPDGKSIGIIKTDPLSSDETLEWYSWQSKETEAPVKFEREHTACYMDQACLSIADTAGRNSIAGWSNDGHLFRVIPGNSYRISGYMRGEDVMVAKGGEIGFNLDLYARTKGLPGEGFLGRGKAYIEYEIMKLLAFGLKNNVPMSVLELGLVRQAFEKGKGGRQWVLDVLDLLARHDVSFAYWEYHGEAMGIFPNAAVAPDPALANSELIATLKEALAMGALR